MIAKKPPMGFNTWNTFGEMFNAQMLCELADAMVERGFKDAGYEYLIVDDHWEMDERDPETGRLVPRPAKFPNGIKEVIDYVHSKGLKFGLYSCAGVKTCGMKPASFNNEYLDAKTFAEWGVDYLKYDYCAKPETQDGDTLYRRMGIALRECGREILFAACNWGQSDVTSWIRSSGAHMYRSTHDIINTYESTFGIFRSQVDKLGASAPFCFNDMDMLTVGMKGAGGPAGNSKGCTPGEYRIQFCTWCMFGVPLILGCDLRNVDEEYRDLLCNEKLIRINQDEEARAPHPIAVNDRMEFMKELSGGEYAVLLINTGTEDTRKGFVSYDMGWKASSGCKMEFEDVLSGEKLTFTDYVSIPVPAHDCRMFIMRLVD